MIGWGGLSMEFGVFVLRPSPISWMVCWIGTLVVRRMISLRSNSSSSSL